MLKNKNDRRAVAFMIIIMASFTALWIYGSEMPLWVFIPAYAGYMVMAVTVSVMAHNHNHVNMWKSNFMNVLQDNWLTVFYGFPVFAWIPTHNTNHHTHVNTKEDYTKTWRYSEKNNLFTLLTYPSVSTKFQMGVVWKYYKDTYKTSKKKFWLNTLQFVCLVTWIAAFVFLDWRKAIAYVIIPQQFSTFSVLIFNYLQHVHGDEEHEFNNSRNFTGKVVNFILLNNGIHLAHHKYPSQHWSDLPETHKAMESDIDPSLNEKSFWGYIFRTYIFSIFVPSLRSKSMRVERMETNKNL